jgi:uridine phosphorylase
MSDPARGTPVLGLHPGDVPGAVFVCGDPARVDRIAAGWQQVRALRAVREFRVVAGVWSGRTGDGPALPLAVASTGVGAPGAAIVVAELARAGARTLIRVGNSGGLADDLALGDLVITTAAVRDDGTSRAYVAPEYPAAADWRVVAALVDAARAAGARWRAGITWSFDAFYARNAALAADGSLQSLHVGGYWTPEHEARIRAMQAAGILNCEMEAGVLLTLAGLFGLRAGALCVVSDRTPWRAGETLDLDRNMDAAIAIAHDAMAQLAADEKL